MKVTSTASAVRAIMSPAEISDLQFVIEAAERAGHYMPARIPDIMAALSIGAASVRAKQAEKRAAKDYALRIERERRARERQFMIGDRYSVTAVRADYADISSDPDSRHWVDLLLQEVMNKPIPQQCEIRRDVWRVRVVHLDMGSFDAVVGSDCSETPNPTEISPIAERLIAKFEARERFAA